MKRIVYLWLGASMLAAFLALSAAGQSTSLGDYARSVRKQKAQKPADTKQFDNDNLPKTDKLNVVGPPPTQSSTATSTETTATTDGSGQPAQATSDGKAEPKADASAPKDDEERQKANKEWEKKIAAQKGQIALLERELDVLQREYRLRAAAMYADAGNRMRNQGAWDREDADYKQKISIKQKALDDAKQKLEDTNEQARKAGVPSSVRE